MIRYQVDSGLQDYTPHAINFDAQIIARDGKNLDKDMDIYHQGTQWLLPQWI